MKLLLLILAGAAAVLVALMLIKVLTDKRKKPEKTAAAVPEQVASDEEETQKYTGDEGRTMLMAYSTLILIEEGGTGRQYAAELWKPVMIGREKSNDICLEDDSVSRRHLKIFRDGGTIWAENLSEMNGTRLNGCRITDLQELRSGDRLTLGRVSLRVDID